MKSTIHEKNKSTVVLSCHVNAIRFKWLYLNEKQCQRLSSRLGVFVHVHENDWMEYISYLTMCEIDKHVVHKRKEVCLWGTCSVLT